MLFWVFVLFHVISLGYCLFATRATFKYLNKHQIVPKYRYMLFGMVRTRYVALMYVMSILTLSTVSLIYALLTLF